MQSLSDYEIEFTKKPYGFKVVGDDNNKNAIVKQIFDAKLDDHLCVGSWVVQVNETVVENWDFSQIVKTLRETELPVTMKFRVCIFQQLFCLLTLSIQVLLMSGTEQQLQEHVLTANMKVEITTTGASKVQPKSGQAFVAYNVVIKDGILKWQLWKRYSQFAELHESLKKVLNSKLPEFPPKQMIRRFNIDFVNTRKNKLQQYINALIRLPVALQSKELREFFIPSAKTSQKRERTADQQYKHPREVLFFFFFKKKKKKKKKSSRQGQKNKLDRLELIIESIGHKSFDSEQVSIGLNEIMQIVNLMCKKNS
ncbi:PX domain containing protein [Reticulomyxa filosa]|uniref:PX domain containing protein n=1 Tax=Reticulomyxa filosa TaxID=46433 RepID=X6NJA4_RETFI|nr:PX domain containing protein [Reticulomyxa filosa]|eukprot:ETO26086.1 PX domain containing protein [Reticulomyxa filosa]